MRLRGHAFNLVPDRHNHGLPITVELYMVALVSQTPATLAGQSHLNSAGQYVSSLV
jgi:hypothetical protein